MRSSRADVGGVLPAAPISRALWPISDVWPTRG
jgi:hypothetical protein